jgi:two-component system chemotaxis response regulator CheB
VTKFRVLICEDSRAYAEALSQTLEHGGEIEVVGVFATAEEAIAELPARKPDLVTMDLELPGISGLEAVEEIMGSYPVPILVLSAHVGPRSHNAAAALAAGALEALYKGELDLTSPDGESASELRRRVKLLSGIRVIRHPRGRLASPRPAAGDGQPARTASVVGICASTGGPNALATILRALPPSFPFPILVVQHISPGFTEGLIRWLGGVIPLPVRRAEHGAPLAPGVWVAPEGSHLKISRSGRMVLDSEPAGRHRPSADVLLQSLAAHAGAEAVAVVLTGMGRDGSEGVSAVRAVGGLAIAQDADSSVVFGMPKAAVEKGAELVLGLNEIAGELLRLRPAPFPS